MAGIGLGIRLAAPRRGAGGPPPAASALFAVNGDSRTQQAAATERGFGSTIATNPLVNAADTKANGWIAHCLARLGHRIDLPRGCQFAIGAETTAQMAARAVQDAAQAKALGATTLVFLGGVNDMALTVAQSVANYTAIFDAFTAQGIRLVICNELPATGRESNPSDHLARRDWLADTARRAAWPDLVQVDTFSPCLKPGTACTWRDGLSHDGTHPAYAGSRLIGQTIADALAPIYPEAQFPGLIRLPVTATQAEFLNAATCMMTGTGGTRSGAPQPVGDVATGWTLAPVSGTQTGLTVTGSKSVSPSGHDEQVIRISGASTLTTMRGATLSTSASLANAVALPAGTRLRAQARLRIDAGHAGLFGAGVGFWIQGTDIDGPGTGFALRRGEAFLGNWMADSSAFEMDGTAVDHALLSQEIRLPAAWAGGTGRQVFVRLHLACQSHGRPVEATVRISQFGLAVVS